MPKRVIDFDAMWGSDKLASCAEWAQAEYAWLYGLADASGCFELMNLRVIWGRVAAIRCNLTIERLEQVFGEFQDKGLLFVWEHEGKRYGHWTGSDVPGRLPPPSWRMRLERLAPPVPKQQLAEYVSRYARGRAGLQCGGLLSEAREGESNLKFHISDLTCSSQGERNCEKEGKHSTDGRGRLPETRPQVAMALLKGGVEEGQAQDLNWNREEGREEKPFAPGNPAAGAGPTRQIAERPQTLFSNSNLDSKSHSNAETVRMKAGIALEQSSANHAGNQDPSGANRGAHAAAAGITVRDKSFLVARELVVGQGPVCGPAHVKTEALDRIRKRDAAREGARSP